MMRNRQKNNRIIYRAPKTALAVLTCVMAVVLGTAFHSSASWVEDREGTRYEEQEGEFAVGFKEIDGQRYYFNEKGYLETGKFYVPEEDAYYYADKEGRITGGVIRTKKVFYVTDDTGRIQTGFVDDENQRYFFDASAELVRGWFKSEDNWYYADDNGVVMTGFLVVDGYRYYLNQDGVRVSDCVQAIDGVTYVFNGDGTIDENATALYPVYEFMNGIRTENGREAIPLNGKVQSCAILRAAELLNGYVQGADSAGVLRSLLNQRGVSCNGGYELSYGGIEGYSIERLIEDMGKDRNLLQLLQEAGTLEVGMGVYEQEGICYYDLIFILP
ncbi:MAG: hypothetical protein NC124_04005 [Clostridium sp.]|nr:hypothetical protein [Clostridium sp.]